MRIDRIRPHRPTSTELLIVRLIRRFAAARMLDEDALVAMTRMVSEAGEPPVIAVALHSVLQITEECLERPLEASCRGGTELSRDERAILALLSHAPWPGAVQGTAEVPHALPDVLCWAVASFNQMIGQLDFQHSIAECCPFGTAASAGPTCATG